MLILNRLLNIFWYINTSLTLSELHFHSRYETSLDDNMKLHQHTYKKGQYKIHVYARQKTHNAW